ncbi:MAG TPA: type II toxin-antitoxin system VapC family toxin [Beijerinckiaceae bacterium]
MIVIDASVAVKWFVPEANHEAALAVLGSGEPLIAPDLVIPETMHALRKKLRAGDVIEGQFLRAGADLSTYFDELVPSASVTEEAMRLSIRLDHGFYDCVYLALSLTSGASLVTADEAFHAKVVSAGLGTAIQGLSEPEHRPERGPLALPRATVESIGRLAQRVSETFKSLQDAHTGGQLRFLPAKIYEPAFESPAYLRLKELALGLTDEERAQVIALGWFGRDYERGPFPPLLDRARSMFAGDPQKDIGYIMSVMSTVHAGYMKLLRLGESQAANE